MARLRDGQLTADSGFYVGIIYRDSEDRTMFVGQYKGRIVARDSDRAAVARALLDSYLERHPDRVREFEVLAE